MRIRQSIEDRLVEDWREAKRMWSVRWNAAGAVLLPLLTLVPVMPAEIQALLPLSVRAFAAAAWSIAAIGFRLWSQKK